MTHPDEGLIHAWLDGELSPDEAARIETLVATDEAWRAAAAEARGLMAASSRILSALDDVPARVIPAATPAPRRMAWWMRAAAAVVVVAGGSVVVLQRGSAPMQELSQGVPTVTGTVRAPSPTAAANPLPLVKAPVAPAPVAPPASTTPSSLATPHQLAQRPMPTASAERVTAANRETSVAPPPSVAANAPAMELRAEAAQDRAVTVRRTAAGAEPRADAAAEASARAASTAAPAAFAMSDTRAARSALGGVAKASSVLPLTCFVVRDADAPTTEGVLMRAMRQMADTVFLAPTESASSVRAWIRAGTGPRPGVRHTTTDVVTVTAITATPTGCPAP